MGGHLIHAAYIAAVADFVDFEFLAVTDRFQSRFAVNLKRRHWMDRRYIHRLLQGPNRWQALHPFPKQANNWKHRHFQARNLTLKR